MHAYNVNQGTYDFFREFQVPSPIESSSDGPHKDGNKFQYPTESKSLTSNYKSNNNFRLRNSNPKIIDSELDEFDTQAVRFKPESLDNLVKLTKFDRRELKLMYRGFKQLCPSGVVKEDKFKLIYAQFFPKSADTNGYARFVFNSFDIQRKQEITFTEFVVGLSVLTRGTIDERLRWIFTLYDLNSDGIITKDELSKIINSVHDLMGKYAVSPSQTDQSVAGANSTDPPEGNNRSKSHSLIEASPRTGGGNFSPSSPLIGQQASSLNSSNEEQAESLLKKFDLNNDGVITLDEFLEACHKDDNIIKSISVFNTVL